MASAVTAPAKDGGWARASMKTTCQMPAKTRKKTSRPAAANALDLQPHHRQGQQGGQDHQRDGLAIPQSAYQPTSSCSIRSSKAVSTSEKRGSAPVT